MANQREVQSQLLAGGQPAAVEGFVQIGFVEVLLVPWVAKGGNGSSNADIELWTRCHLQSQEMEAVVIVENSKSVLMQMKKAIRNDEPKQAADTPISSKVLDSCQVVEAGVSDMELTFGKDSPLFPGEDTPEGEANGVSPGDGDQGQCARRRSKCSALKNYFTATLEQLRDLERKSYMQVSGRVVFRQCVDNQEYFVVLFDVYIPGMFCTPGPHHRWKGGTHVSVGLSHVSNNYERRRQVLDQRLSYSLEDIFNIGTCHVIGCETHLDLSEAEKSERFNLNAIFSTLPGIVRSETRLNTCVEPSEPVRLGKTGIYHLPDEVLSGILSKLNSSDLSSCAAVCRHCRALVGTVLPSMNVKLFPHQESAVRWMLQRERVPQELTYPHIGHLFSEDGKEVYFDKVTGGLYSEALPSVFDFRGGMVCDEPGLGKTVTALSLILKTQGVVATAPPNVNIQWCEHTSQKWTGYYEVSTRNDPYRPMSTLKRCSLLKGRRDQSPATVLDSPSSSHRLSPSSPASSCSTFSKAGLATDLMWPFSGGQVLPFPSPSTPTSQTVESHASGTSESPQDSCRAKRKLWDSSPDNAFKKARRCSTPKRPKGRTKEKMKDNDLLHDEDDKWVQCDACGKWRKIPAEGRPLKEGMAWFCSMNEDELHQDCTLPEEIFDKNEMITCLPGFVHMSKETDTEVNVPFFRNVFRSHVQSIDEEAKKALKWLGDLPREKVVKAATEGLQLPPTLQMAPVGGVENHPYEKILGAFGLTKRKERKKSVRWFYPKNLNNLVFDCLALKEAIAEPVDEVMRFYLSKATLVVVPNNLIEHWRTQILKHISRDQLRFFIWTDVKRLPAAHVLAWEYDVVITTFSRLSAEWNNRNTSPLARIHWLRIVLDEGHTLGASIASTNKLNMAVGMRACRRWILTGTPTPNTPTTQVGHLLPMLKFLHEEIYGNHPKFFDAAVLRPFEACTEEGRNALVNVLSRCMISARKCDLRSIPTCTRKRKLLDFTNEEHAASYNELVVTVKRNILMADWRDPSHIESLLNPKKWKERNNTLRNVRLSCCVAGHIKVYNANRDIDDTMAMLVEKGVSEMSREYYHIRSCLLIGGLCDRCSEYSRLPAITPCRHLLCLTCVELDCTKCSLCNHPYLMQVPKPRPDNPSPKWPVPQNLIELQPSYVQDNWDPDWRHTTSSKIAYLVGQLWEMNTRNERIFSQHLNIMVRKAAEKEVKPEKAIVYSQFLEHINVIEKQFVDAGINHVGMYSPMQMRDKMKSLKRFKEIPECTVLILDGSHALGLDLSFVSRVYLMEPIWDSSVEEQVVSRAHRMGASQPITVETLAMRGTIEEQMIAIKESIVKSGSSGKESAEYYLQQLDFVHGKKS